jgi:predicted Zn-dependent protease
MIHYAEREGKIGKKIWIWGLSRQGMIWEKLLTDHSGQYTEIQSGRLYNQNAPQSLFSPFKQFDFAPYSTDTWSEYWYPFQNTDGVANADLNGVINIKTVDGKKVIFISPVSYINDTLKVWDTKEDLILNQPVTLKPLQSFRQNISLKEGQAVSKITLAGSTLSLNDSAEKILDRPLEPHKNFDWNTAYGFYLKGKYEADTRHYELAENNIRSSLSKETAFIPSLDEMAFLQYRKMNYDSAYYFARTALSVNTYDPAANYFYGLAALQLNKLYDAEDGFEVAAITPQYRSAAYTELSKIKLRQKNYQSSFEYAEESLVNNSQNISALQLQYVCSRLMRNTNAQKEIKAKVLQLDPMNHFIRFEEYWQNKNAVNKQKFTFLIRDELPQQTYLDLAIWYSGLALAEESKAVLEACPQKDDEILYWLAWLHRSDEDAAKYWSDASNGHAYMIFPFRAETVSVMQWAMKQSTEWKSRYYLSLIDAFHNQKQKALQLLEEGNAPADFAPFYVLRSRLRNSSDVENIQADLSKAREIDKHDWRYGKYLTEFLIAQKKYKEALQIIEPYYKKDKNNYVVGLVYINCLVLNDHYDEAETILNTINILPNEGARDGHKYYEEIKLMLALQFLEKHNYKAALQKVNEARQWPESLGVGEPYANMINDELENDIQKLINQTKQGQKLSAEVFNNYKTKVKAITNRNAS